MHDEHTAILERLVDRGRKRAPASRPALLLATAVLLAAGCWMLYLTYASIEPLRVWDLQDPWKVIGWLRGVLWRGGWQVMVFFAVGLVVAGLVPGKRPTRSDSESTGSDHPLKDNSRSRGLSTVAPLLHLLVPNVYLGGCMIVTLLLLTRLSPIVGLEGALDAALGSLGLLLGVWIGGWWRRAPGRLAWQAVGLCGGIILGTLWLYAQIFQSRPLDFPTIQISSADKRQLVEAVQEGSIDRGDVRVYRLSESELNKLLAWAMAFESLDGKARATLRRDTQRLEFSLPFPPTPDSSQYVNVTAQGHFEFQGDELELDLQDIRLGGVRLPAGLVGWAGETLVDWVTSDPENLRLLAGVRSISAGRGRVELQVVDDGLSRRRLAKALRQMGDHPDVSPQVEEILTRLAEIQKEAERKEPLFDPLVRTAFRHASDWSGNGMSPLEANRAAILALGIALGHRKVEQFIGRCTTAETRRYVYRLPRHSQLRGRADWARHFWVSAAVTLLASDQLSDEAGLLKEELDAGEGGSGFSFADLMADRSGTEFARAATRDRYSARAIQQWVLDADTDLNELMPPADDLPEGMTETEMQEKFGGVGGRRYREMIQKIENRLRKVAWRRGAAR